MMCNLLPNIQSNMAGIQWVIAQCTASEGSFDGIQYINREMVFCQEPITKSVQLPHIPVTAFPQTDLFLV